MWYCIYEGLVDEVYLRNTPDGVGEFGFVVNAYIHLLPATGRRGSLMKKIHLENSQSKIQASSNFSDRKRQHEDSNQATKFPWVSPRQFYLERVSRDMEVKNRNLKKELEIAQSKAIPTPALPTKPVRASLWPPEDNVPAMPDSL